MYSCRISDAIKCNEDFAWFYINVNYIKDL